MDRKATAVREIIALIYPERTVAQRTGNADCGIHVLTRAGS
jgi:hypothetical protein